MRLVFEATIDDFLAVHRDWIARQRDRVKVSTPAWMLIWLALALAVAGSYAVARVAGPSAHNLLFGALHGLAAGCIGGAALLVPIAVFRKSHRDPSARYLRTVRRLMESGAIPIDPGPHAVELDGDTLVFTDPVRVVCQPLASFDALEEHRDCFYLMRRTNPDFRIPKAAFRSQEQMHEFRRRIEDHLIPQG